MFPHAFERDQGQASGFCDHAARKSGLFAWPNREGVVMPLAPRLGVPLMDRDHAAIDFLFGAAATTADSELPALLDTIAEELHDHFAREEAMMAEARVPFLFHHFELHTQLLREIENMRREVARSDAASARQLIGVLLLRFVADHVATADAAAARFLIGRTERPSDLTPRVARTD